MQGSSTQGEVGITIVFHNGEIAQGRVFLGCFRNVRRRRDEVVGKGHIAVGGDALGRAGRGPNAGKLGSYYEEIRSEMESSGEIPSLSNPPAAAPSDKPARSTRPVTPLWA